MTPEEGESPQSKAAQSARQAVSAGKKVIDWSDTLNQDTKVVVIVSFAFVLLAALVVVVLFVSHYFWHLVGLASVCVAGLLTFRFIEARKRQQEAARAQRLETLASYVDGHSGPSATPPAQPATPVAPPLGSAVDAGELKRCIDCQQDTFTSAPTCRACGNRMVGRDLVDGFVGQGVIPRAHELHDRFSSLLAGLCSEYVAPFLKRNISRPPGTAAASVETMARFGKHTWATIPDDELTLLRSLLQREGLPLEEMGTSWQELLTACSLFLDYEQLRLRLTHVCSLGSSWQEAFLGVSSGDPRYLPWIVHYLHQIGEPRSAGEVAALLAQEKEAHRLRSFERDLQTRSEGGSLNVTLELIDSMNCYAFELLVGMMYESQGYAIEETPKSGDQGADVIVAKAGERTVIQTKLYSGTVGNKAVQEAAAARSHHGCHNAMVVTNNYYTSPARALAETNTVELMDRDGLAELLARFNDSPKDYTRLQTLLEPDDPPDPEGPATELPTTEPPTEDVDPPASPGPLLLECPACHGDVSSAAPACPKCGHPMQARDG